MVPRMELVRTEERLESAQHEQAFQEWNSDLGKAGWDELPHPRGKTGVGGAFPNRDGAIIKTWGANPEVAADQTGGRAY